MPNGKGSSDWGWTPGPEEGLIFLFVTFIVTLALSTFGLPTLSALPWGLLIGIISGFLLLWGNNGWPRLKK